MAPSVFQTLAVTGAMGWAIATMEFGNSPSAATSQLRTVAESVHHPLVWLVIVVVGIWQAWIWAAGLERARNLEPGEAKLTAGLVAVIGILSSLT